MADDDKRPRVRLPVVPEEIDRGLRFNHIVAHQSRVKNAELTASFYALLETLVASGAIAMDEYEKRRETALARERDKAKKELAPLVSYIADKYKLDKLPDIDCEARLPLCKARCCTLKFPLSLQDLDERVVRWDYGRPYQIGQRADGYCVHNEPGTCRCNVYEQRPGICRTYDCRKDKRIWIDFDARIPAPVPAEPPAQTR